jgi:hypothetical protein
MGLPAKYLLDDPAPRAALGRLCLCHDVVTDLKLHRAPPIVGFSPSVLRGPAVGDPQRHSRHVRHSTTSDDLILMQQLGLGLLPRS